MEKFNAPNSNKTFQDKIEEAKSKKNNGMDESLALMRDSEHYDEVQKEREKEKENKNEEDFENMDNMGDSSVADFKLIKDQLIKKEEPKEEKLKAKTKIEVQKMKTDQDYINLAKEKIGVTDEEFEKSRQRRSQTFREVMASRDVMKAKEQHGLNSDEYIEAKAIVDLVEKKAAEEKRQNQKAKDGLTVIGEKMGKNSKQYKDYQENLAFDEKKDIKSKKGTTDEPVIQESIEAQVMSKDEPVEVALEKKDYMAEHYDEMMKKGKEKIEANKEKASIVNETPEAKILSEDLEEKAMLNVREGVETPIAGISVENIKGEKGKNSAESLKIESDKLFKEALVAKEKLQEVEKGRGVFRKIQNVLGSSDSEEGHINKEFKDAKKAFETAQTAYREKYTEFANKIIAEKKVEIKQKEGVESKRVASNEKLVEGTERNLEGQLEKMTIFEYMRQNEEKLLAERIENLDEKQKGLYNKMKNSYKNLPKSARFALSFAVSVGVGAGAGALIGTGVAAHLGYEVLGKKFIKKVAMWAGVGAVVGGAHRLLKQDTTYFKKDSKNKAEKKIVESLEAEKGDIFKNLDEHYKQIRRKEKREKFLIGGLAVSTGALLGSFDLDEINNHFDGVVEHASGADIPAEPVVEIIPPEPEGAVAENLSKGHIDRQDALEEMKGTTKDYIDGQDALEEMKGTTKDHIDGIDTIEGVLLNQDFELKPGGNVWNSLSEHFNNNQKVGKTLVEFKSGIAENLAEKHGMTDARAAEFMKWRFEHMDVGTKFDLENGKLDIPGFDDEGQIRRFDAQNPNVLEANNPARPGYQEAHQADVAEHAEKVAKNEEIYSAKNNLDSVNNENAELFDIDNEINADSKITQAVDENVAKIYESWGKNQDYEWNVMRGKSALDVIGGEYGNPIGIDGKEIDLSQLPEVEKGSLANNGLDQVEINNRNQLRQYLIKLRDDTRLYPKAGTLTSSGETVEAFIRRAEASKLS